MQPLAWFLLGSFAAISLALVSYNRFVQQKAFIRNSWANVEAELARRYDLVPNLVETVKGYASHERAVLEQCTAARSRAMSSTGSPETQAADESTLVRSVSSLLAVSEGYPDLQASEHFRLLQVELVSTEDRIQLARRIFNNNVRDYNRRVQSLPSALIAAVGRFTVEEYFQVDPIVAGPSAVDLS